MIVFLDYGYQKHTVQDTIYKKLFRAVWIYKSIANNFGFQKSFKSLNQL